MSSRKNVARNFSQEIQCKTRKKFNARLARNLNQEIGEKKFLKRSRLEYFILQNLT